MQAFECELEAEVVERPHTVGQLGRVQQDLERLCELLDRFAVLRLQLLVVHRLEVVHRRRERRARKGLHRGAREQILDLSG